MYSATGFKLVNANLSFCCTGTGISLNKSILSVTINGIAISTISLLLNIVPLARKSLYNVRMFPFSVSPGILRL